MLLTHQRSVIQIDIKPLKPPVLTKSRILHILSQNLTGKHDLEEIEAQQLPLGRLNRVRRPPAHLYNMAKVAVDDTVTCKEGMESAEREDIKRAMKEEWDSIEVSKTWK